MNSSLIGFVRVLAFCVLTILYSSVAIAVSTAAPAKTESMDELYEKAKKEGGRLVLYIALSARSEEVIVPAFKKRFPAIQVKLVARAVGYLAQMREQNLLQNAIAEARGGRVLGDVFGGTPGYLAQMREQNLLQNA